MIHRVRQAGFNAVGAFSGISQADRAARFPWVSILPLSPDAMLHTQVGNQRLQNWTASREQTGLLQRVVAERAFRWVVAGEETRRVSWFRPRYVDLQVYREEEHAFAE